LIISLIKSLRHAFARREHRLPAELDVGGGHGIGQTLGEFSVAGGSAVADGKVVGLGHANVSFWIV
jgi:hypothetical protein